MTRLFALVFTFFCSVAQAQPIAEIKLNQPSYTAGQDAHVRYRLAATPESPAYEFFLMASLDAEPIQINKITETEFYSKLEDLTAGTNKTISLSIYLRDRALGKALEGAVRHHDSEIARLTDEISQADPEDIPALEAELAMNQARRADALSKLNSIRRLVGTNSIQFDVN